MSHLALEDVEALCFGNSFLMADPMGPLLDHDDDEAVSPSSSLEGKAPASPSPSLSFSNNTSPLSPYQVLFSAPPSPPATPPSPSSCSSFLDIKVGTDSTSWLSPSDLLDDDDFGAEVGKDDSFADVDWMTEKIDLNDFDLESLICSYSSDESAGSPEELLASLDPHIDLALESITAQPEEMELDFPVVPPLPMELSESAEEEKTEVALDPEMVIKSEPLSPAPSSPALDPAIEDDQSDPESSPESSAATSGPDSSASTPSTRATPSSSDCDSDSGFESFVNSPSRQSPPHSPASASSSRTKPYCKPEPGIPHKPSKVKSVSGAPRVVEKKLKKMEQNKTAATRYRQKKRVEQDLLTDELEELQKKNHELQEEEGAISKEIQYLRNLMEEARKRHLRKISSVA